jgi:Uma2 family endonuclease
MAIRARLKADYLWETPDDGNRYEVIDGELYVTPPPTWDHQRGLSKLHIRLGTFIYERGLGEIVTAPVGVVLDADTAVQPDLVYVSRERAHLISRRGLEGAPDLVVEFMSPSTRRRDRGLKMQKYAAAGVLHYWIVDPRTRALEDYRLGQQGYELTGTHGPGTTFQSELFPGLEIPIDELWA